MPSDFQLKPYWEPRDLRIDYEHELNDQQRAAVTAPPGPALIIAGAGAGKTRTLVFRVAFLLEQGVRPERILLLTFTNKAAREMMQRVKDLLGSDLASLWGGTFHAVGNRVLRRHADLLGYRSDFTILDREDANSLIKACVTEKGVRDAKKLFPKPDVLGDMFSLATNTRQSLPLLIETQYPHCQEFQETILALALAYQARKKAANAMDFDDLLVLWLEVLTRHPEVCESWQRRFQFILVDEYQDTNQIQSDLIDLLAARHHNLMVVGDDAQSIYSWRGANFQNILKFPKRYPEAKIYKIETNYRSTPEILAVANAAIRHNAHQFAKELVPVCRNGAKPALVPCNDADEQAAFVTQRVLQLHEEGLGFHHMVVLYRSHFHALELQLALTRSGIPFQITSGVRFFEQAHVKDLSAYLKLIHNPLDEPAFKRLVLILPGIGAKGAAKLWTVYEGGLRKAGPEGGRLKTALQTTAPAVPKKARAAWDQFQETLRQLDAPTLKSQPSAMIRLILESGYDDQVKANYSNYRSRLEDLDQLAMFAADFSNLESLLSQLALLSGVDTEGNPAFAQQEGQLRLSTVHQAKGLEFDVVFVIMLCEGLFPNARALKESESEEEERRLFYVAVTRARRELYLCYPFLRFKGGYQGSASQIPSRFLGEIEAELVNDLRLHL